MKTLRFDWGISLGQLLLLAPMVVYTTIYFVNTNAQAEKNKEQMDQLRADVATQISDLKKDVAEKFQTQQTSNTANFTALTTAIANIPGISAALPEMRDRIARMEQDRVADRARLDGVQAKGVETAEQLKAALQAGIASQRTVR